jgi:hypothetical protein
MRGACTLPLLSKVKTARLISALAASIMLAISVLPVYAGESGKNFLRFGEMYSSASSLGLALSEKLLSLNGKNVVMEGFMAPPLKPTLRFFVLTSVPMAICPFCSTDSDWPNDIVLVFLRKEAEALPFDRPIRVEGVLELGTKTDEETGFVSLVRIYATRVEAVM